MMDTASLEQALTFKSQKRTSPRDKRPLAKDLSHHLSQLAERRRPSPLKELFKYIHPGILSFAGGIPSPKYFPLEKFSADVPGPNTFTNPNLQKHLRSLQTSIITVPKYPADIPINLSVLLQYGMVTGLPALNKFLLEFVEKVYVPGYRDYNILLSCGNTDALYKIFNLLLDPGDFILVEEYTYPSALEALYPLQAQTVAVKVDREGMLDTDLEEILSTWDLSWRGRGRRPRVIYTVTVGQNPTGGTLSFERRKKIYALCQKYDVLIIEDDPYYFLQMPEYGSKDAYPTSESEFLESLIPSYLRIDVDGRVLRCDSFSKVIAPGSRAGWITAAPIFIERLTRHAEVGTQATSGWTQTFIAKLLVDEWKMEGWIEWLRGLGLEYTKRRDYIIGAISKELEIDTVDDAEEGEYVVVMQRERLISFVPPTAGMFLWVRIALELHPRYDGSNSIELMDLLWKRLAVTEDLLVAPGKIFAAGDEQRDEAAKYFRIAFSIGEQKEVDDMVKRFGRAMRWFFKGPNIAIM